MSDVCPTCGTPNGQPCPCEDTSFRRPLGSCRQFSLVAGVFILIATCFLCSSVAEAGFFRRRARHPRTAPRVAAAPSVGFHGSDQARCEQEAAYMARHNIKGHVGGVIGRFEGCGWSSGGTPGTCTPSRGMTLTGDAIRCSQYGCFRVRSWR